MTATHPTHGAHAPSAKREWAGGLTVFAAVTLMLVGVLDIFRGIMGIAEDDVFVTTQNYVFKFDLTAWGWTHLVLGALAVLVGMGLGRARDDDPQFPGRIGWVYSEEAARGFYAQWQRLLTDPEAPIIPEPELEHADAAE